ncbi:helix-turn-helix domain-containing protein, partial [Bacteroides pyogenes]
LIQLINKHYKQERHAKFYAGLLGISLQHLSTTVKAVTGKTVSETIAYVIIMDAKAKLKGSDMTIKEIAYSLNFSNASFFGKYFKRHVGMTPLQFRNQ